MPKPKTKIQQTKTKTPLLKHIKPAANFTSNHTKPAANFTSNYLFNSTSNTTSNHTKPLTNHIFYYTLIAVLTLLFAAAILLTSCVNYSTDGTAAQVGDVKISEDSVSAAVQNFRASQNLATDEAWEKYLSANNQKPKDVRDKFLDQLIDDEVYRQIAADYGITAANDDQLKNAVAREFIKEAKPTKEAYSQLLAAYGEKFNGSKGYYQLMFKNDEEAKATQVLSELKSCKLTFDDAIATRLTEDTMGVNFDYVIYDCLIVNPDPCPSVLAGMHPGQMSDLVKTKDYIYIFKVVDEIHCGVPLTSLSDLSDYTQDNLKHYAKVMDQANIVKQAFADRKKSIPITKYTCPTSLPY